MRQSGVASLGRLLRLGVWTHDHDHHLPILAVLWHGLYPTTFLKTFLSRFCSSLSVLISPFHLHTVAATTSQRTPSLHPPAPLPSSPVDGKVGNTCNKDDVEELMVFCVGFGYVALTNTPVLCASP